MEDVVKTLRNTEPCIQPQDKHDFHFHFFFFHPSLIISAALKELHHFTKQRWPRAPHPNGSFTRRAEESQGPLLHGWGLTLTQQ